MTKAHLKAAGILIGMIFGAGVFALPYAVSRAGIFWGAFYFILAFLLMSGLHHWYGEVAYHTEGRHRLTGYAKILIGERAKWAAFLITIFTGYGSLLVYGLLGGIFLSNIFSLSAFTLSLLIFLGGGFLIIARLNKIAGFNFYLTVVLLGLVLVLVLAALPYFKIENLSLLAVSASDFSGRFLPYGIWLFALAGFAALPEARDILFGAPIRDFKKVIFISLFVCAIFYAIFSFTVLGVSGKNVSEDALGGLISVMGRPAVLVGSLLGFLAVFTSFIALAADLKNIFRYDFNFSHPIAWLSVVVPPIGLFLVGSQNFIKILGIIGAIGLGLIGILIILMRERLGRLRGEAGKNKFLFWLTGSLVVLGIIAELISELS